MTIETDPTQKIAWIPEFIYAGNRCQSNRALVCNAAGTIVRIVEPGELNDEKRINLPRRALLPGMVNAHSHAFQRVLRGRTEYGGSGQRDSFWTWRDKIYAAATRLSPEDIYDASCMTFLEMALTGITAVGEFHYLHHAPDGSAYEDPNLLAREVIRAAGDIGLRIALLRVAYARSGFQRPANPSQARFIEADADVYLKNVEELNQSIRSANIREGLANQTSARTRDLAVPYGRAAATAWAGVAPHSVRAVPLNYLKQVIDYANERDLRIHMHVAEQPAEVSACVEEYGRTPVALLQTEGFLSERFTAVHAIHVTPKAIASFAQTGAAVCACPTTERNLGDGVVPADEYLKHGVTLCLGTDSHAQIDLLEDARELEYHLRLQRLERAVLDDQSQDTSLNSQRLAARLFESATVNGARSIGAPTGALEADTPADFFTVDLDDPSIAGASPGDLLASIVFAASRSAVREVVVGGKPIVSESRHLNQEEIVERFNTLQKKLWG